MAAGVSVEVTGARELRLAFRDVGAKLGPAIRAGFLDIARAVVASEFVAP